MNVSALVLASLVLAMLSSLALTLALRRLPEQGGAYLWTLAFAPLAVGQALKVVEVGSTLQVVLRDPLVLTGHALLLAGLRQSLHLPRIWLLPVAIVLGSLVSNAVFTAVWPLPLGRDAVRLLGMAVLSGACFFSCRKLREPALGPVRRFLEGIFGLLALLSLARFALLGLERSETVAACEDLARLSQGLLLLGSLLGLMLLLVARMNRRLERLSMHDPLTGLLNRQGLDDAVHTLLALARRLGRPVGLLLCEPGDVRPGPDAPDAAFRDEVLKALGWQLQQVFEAAELIGRPDAHRFVVLLPGAGSAQTLRTAERLCERMKVEPVMLDGRPTFLSVSTGALSLPALAAQWPAMLQQAEEALREAKTRGRDACVLASVGEPINGERPAPGAPAASPA